MPDESVVFDRAADYYDETRGFPDEVAGPVAEIIAKAGSLNRHSRILEIGVGTGRIALPLSRHVQAYYGIDLSVPMMKRLHKKQTTERVYVAEADATQIPFADGVFDAVIAVHVFHLIANWRDALAEAKRVLRHGALMLCCWNAGIESQAKPLHDAWHAAVPPERRALVGIDPEDDPDFALNEGWELCGDRRVYEYDVAFIPQLHVERLRRRVWSRLWRLTDSELHKGLAAVQGAVAQLFDDPLKPLPEKEQFCVQAYRVRR